MIERGFLFSILLVRTSSSASFEKTGLTYSRGKSPMANTQLSGRSQRSRRQGDHQSLPRQLEDTARRFATYSRDVLPQAPSPTMTSFLRICTAAIPRKESRANHRKNIGFRSVCNRKFSERADTNRNGRHCTLGVMSNRLAGSNRSAQSWAEQIR